MNILLIYPNINGQRQVQMGLASIAAVLKGNGNKVIKLEFNIGSAMEMYGALGHKYFSSIIRNSRELTRREKVVLLFRLKKKTLN